MQLLRYLLDTCATANAAREALYEAKQYDEYAVVHYLVADDELLPLRVCSGAGLADPFAFNHSWGLQSSRCSRR